MLREQVFSGEEGDRHNVPNYAVLLTDGDPDDLGRAVREAVTSRIDGTRLLVVGVGINGQRRLEYSAMASYPQDRTVMSVRRFSQLPSLTVNLTAALTDGRETVLILAIYSVYDL